METMLMLIVPLLVTGLLLLPVLPLWRGTITGKKAKNRLVVNLGMFCGMILVAVLAPFGLTASAADAVTTAAGSVDGLALMAVALPTVGSCLGAGIAVKAAATAAIGAISENPKSFGKAIIFVALGEGVAIYGLLLSFMMLNKI